MSESKRSRKLKRRWAHATQLWKGSHFGCWDNTRDAARMSHTCRVCDPLHTGPHLCCCGYEWEDEDG